MQVCGAKFPDVASLVEEVSDSTDTEATVPIRCFSQERRLSCRTDRQHWYNYYTVLYRMILEVLFVIFLRAPDQYLGTE